MIEVSFPETALHAREVADLALRVGCFLGLPGEALAEVEMAGCFHDVGKAAVPERVLRKPGPLNRTEWRLMAYHVDSGVEILRHLPECAPIARVVRHHHERWDGEGYPDGLAGDEIPRASRIIGVCDAYAAMVADRPYRPALDPLVAREELRREAGSQFDPDAVRALLEATTPDPSPGAHAKGI
jgi:HD-GYP domain-containing protein (c-di-GMP phosphodiesterase class II)